MAIRPICGRIRTFGRAAAAARARLAPVERDTAGRLANRFQVDRTVTAEARSQQQQPHPCVLGRAIARVRACSLSGNIGACAEARARAAQAFIIRCQRQASAAGAVAASRLERAHYRTISNFLRVAYGESAPMVLDLTCQSVFAMIEVQDSRGIHKTFNKAEQKVQIYVVTNVGNIENQ